MLRNALCEFKGVGTWPCDEINYIWRHGNIHYETDELPCEMATPKVKGFITKEFDEFADKHKLNFLIEKTCANSLRVPFVDRIIPEAKYIFMIRDGMDVVGSASIRWRAKLDIPYIFKKIRYIPLFDLPLYSYHYISSRLYKLFSKEKRLSFWGPRFKNSNKVVKKYSLEEICAIQWQRCVTLSEESFQNISSDRIIRVKYEDFVLNPDVELRRITGKLGITHTVEQIYKAVKVVSSDNIGKGRKLLNKNKLIKVSSLILKTLRVYGYKY